MSADSGIRPSDSLLAVLAVRAGEHLLARGLRLVTAESCTGGYVAKLLTDVPGSSRWFECGYVCYSNAAKERDLDVPAATLRLHGAVSGETVEAMALGALVRSGADCAVTISGVAGPDGGTERHPVGEVWFGIGRREAGVVNASVARRRFAGDRDAVRRLSAAFALELVLAS